MSDISPEDREALVMLKYGELFDKTLAARLKDANFVQELKKVLDSVEPRAISGDRSESREQPQQQRPQSQGKRNLLEVALGL